MSCMLIGYPDGSAENSPKIRHAANAETLVPSNITNHTGPIFHSLFDKVVSSTDGTFLAGISGTMYISRDSGQTWTADSTLSISNAQDIYLTTNDHLAIVYRASELSVRISYDQANTWSDPYPVGNGGIQQWTGALVAMSENGLDVAVRRNNRPRI